MQFWKPFATRCFIEQWSCTLLGVGPFPIISVECPKVGSLLLEASRAACSALLSCARAFTSLIVAKQFKGENIWFAIAHRGGKGYKKPH